MRAPASVGWSYSRRDRWARRLGRRETHASPCHPTNRPEERKDLGLTLPKPSNAPFLRTAVRVEARVVGDISGTKPTFDNALEEPVPADVERDLARILARALVQEFRRDMALPVESGTSTDADQVDAMHDGRADR